MNPAASQDAHRCSTWILLAVAGALIWVCLLVGLHPSPFDTQWARLLLLLAPLVLVPLGLNLWERSSKNTPRIFRLIKTLQLPAAVLLAISEMQMPGWPAAALAAPWLITTLLIAMVGLRDVWFRQRSFDRLARDAALVYIAIGGAWAVVDRTGWRPLDFDPVIVMLTSIHFHFAGFLLPMVTGLTAQRIGGRAAKAAEVGVVLGMPLVAIGITGTKLGLWPIFETVAALWMSIAGSLTSYSLFRAARLPAVTRLVATMWTIAGVSLAASMALAALYGLRHLMPLAWLDIPLMRVTHGTANALGFGVFATLGWTLELCRPISIRLTRPFSTQSGHFSIE